MTEVALIAIITALCNTQPTKSEIITCYEEYTNCAVTSTGEILPIKDLTTKCIKKGAK